MFFLIRAVFWLTIVILLIPGDPENGFEPPRVGIGEALNAAGATVADISGFCTRNPDTCATGGAALQVIGDKAAHGARLLYGFLQDQFDQNETVAVPAVAPVAPEPGTLKPDELTVPWQPPAVNGDA